MHYNRKRDGELVHLGDLILKSKGGKAFHGRPVWEDKGTGERVEKFYDHPTRSFKTRTEFQRLQATRAEERCRQYIGGRRSSMSATRRAARAENMSAIA